MNFILPFSPLVLTFVMIGCYLGAMWWLLREEKWKALAGVGLVTFVAFLLRMWNITELPPGLNDDEVKALKYSAEVFGNRAVFSPGIYVSMLWTSLFYAPFFSLTGSILWTSRIVPILFGTAAVPLSFSLGRALSFGVIPSLVIASLVASMPWAVFWSRQQWGIAVVFHQALLLCALARFIWKGGGKFEVFIGTLGLVGILYDYSAGWPMLGMPFVAILLASSMRQRVRCLLVVVLAVVLWIPWLCRSDAWLHYMTARSMANVASPESFIPTFLKATKVVLRTLVYPEGAIYWISLQGVAMHPVVVLVAGGLGLMSCLFRRALFLSLGFFAGLLPAILSLNGVASGHRMLAAYLFISVAVGALFEFLLSSRVVLRVRAPAVAAAGVFALVAGMQGMQIFFSPPFWHKADDVFWYGITTVSESIELPVTRPTLVDFELSRFLEVRRVANPGYTVLSHETWMPRSSIEHNITPPLSFVLPLYQEALPASQIQTFGTGKTLAFRAAFNDADVAEWQRYGWTAEARCGSQTLAKSRMPFLIFGSSLQWTWRCVEPQTMVYRGVWSGGEKALTLWMVGSFNVEVRTTSGVVVQRPASPPNYLNFDVHPNDEITITAHLQNGFQMRLLEGRDGLGELVRLREVRPLE